MKDTMRASFENNLPRRLVLRFVLVGANEQAQVGGSSLLLSQHARGRKGLFTVVLLRQASGNYLTTCDFP